MNRAVMTSTTSSTYDFFLPICAKIWRIRFGYEPLIFFVGTPEEWSSGHRKVVFDEIVKEKYPIEWLGHVEGVDDSIISMSIRQHAPALSWLDPSDLMLVADIDLWPINKEFWAPHDTNKNELAIRYSDMYEGGKYCAIGPCMSIANWREVMGLIVGDPVGSMMKSFEDGGLRELVKFQKENPMAEGVLWFFDEITTTRRIVGSRFASNFLPMNVPYQEGRLCKNTWPDKITASKYLDAHCPRPGWSYENWKKIKDLLRQILPSEFPWLDHYVVAYRKAGPSIGDPSV